MIVYVAVVFHLAGFENAAMCVGVNVMHNGSNRHYNKVWTPVKTCNEPASYRLLRTYLAMEIIPHSQSLIDKRFALTVTLGVVRWLMQLLCLDLSVCMYRHVYRHASVHLKKVDLCGPYYLYKYIIIII